VQNFKPVGPRISEISCSEKTSCVKHKSFRKLSFSGGLINISKFHHFRYVASNSPDHSSFENVCSVMQQWVYGTSFSSKLQKRLVEVWGRTLSTLLSTNEKCISLPLFTQIADISNIYCQQLHKWTSGWTVNQVLKFGQNVLNVCSLYQIMILHWIKMQYFACSAFPR